MCAISKQEYVVETTSYQRKCDVITSHQRQYDVIGLRVSDRLIPS